MTMFDYHKYSEGDFKDAPAGSLFTAILGDPLIVSRAGTASLLRQMPELFEKDSYKTEVA